MQKPDYTIQDVANWMLSEVMREAELHHESAVGDICAIFGERFTYENDAGNPAIDKKVLTAFKQISGLIVVWDRSRRVWRLRDKDDEASRSQP